tara:strand:+ start:353 stop:676 length:324 start_codon:yes stop_codon:yes gene_type:complete
MFVVAVACFLNIITFLFYLNTFRVCTWHRAGTWQQMMNPQLPQISHNSAIQELIPHQKNLQPTSTGMGEQTQPITQPSINPTINPETEERHEGGIARDCTVCQNAPI